MSAFRWALALPALLQLPLLALLFFSGSARADYTEYRYSTFLNGGMSSGWSHVRGQGCGQLPTYDEPTWITSPAVCGYQNASMPRVVSFYWDATNNICQRRQVNGNGGAGCVFDPTTHPANEETRTVPGDPPVPQSNCSDLVGKKTPRALTFPAGDSIVVGPQTGLETCDTLYGDPLQPGTGCAITVNKLSMCGSDGLVAEGEGKQCWMDAGGGTYTGLPCVPENTPAENSSDLPPGMCRGTVNGTEVVYPCANIEDSTSKTTTKTTSIPEGGTKTESTTTETTVECEGDSCTTRTTRTVTTTTTGSGTPTTTVTEETEEETQDREDFCAENPDHAMCRESAFGGTCDTSFECDGDAALCAIAKATSEQKCLLESGGDEAQLYASSVAAGTDTGIPSVTHELSGGSFDQTDLLGGGACIGDRDVTVAGHTLTIAFSSVCPHLATLGTILVAVSLLLAARIVFRD